MALAVDSCGCFPTGRHYPGIAHLLKVTVRGASIEWDASTPISELPIAMLDVETTGTDPTTDRVIELGIVVGQRGVVVRRHNWMINPQRPISVESQQVHGISDADVADAPTFAAVAHEITDALRGTLPAAYNATFDRGFVFAELERAMADTTGIASLARQVMWIDPLVWARELHADERSRRLEDVAARLGVKLENAHRASDDAEAALHVFYKLALDPRIPRAYGELVQEQRRLALKQADERRLWRGN